MDCKNANNDFLCSESSEQLYPLNKPLADILQLTKVFRTNCNSCFIFIFLFVKIYSKIIWWHQPSGTFGGHHWHWNWSSMSVSVWGFTSKKVGPKKFFFPRLKTTKDSSRPLKLCYSTDNWNFWFSVPNMTKGPLFQWLSKKGNNYIYAFRLHACLEQLPRKKIPQPSFYILFVVLGPVHICRPTDLALQRPDTYSVITTS